MVRGVVLGATGKVIAQETEHPGREVARGEQVVTVVINCELAAQLYERNGINMTKRNDKCENSYILLYQAYSRIMS